eukprot:160569_1
MTTYIFRKDIANSIKEGLLIPIDTFNRRNIDKSPSPIKYNEININSSEELDLNSTQNNTNTNPFKLPKRLKIPKHDNIFDLTLYISAHDIYKFTKNTTNINTFQPFHNTNNNTNDNTNSNNNSFNQYSQTQHINPSNLYSDINEFNSNPHPLQINDLFSQNQSQISIISNDNNDIKSEEENSFELLPFPKRKHKSHFSSDLNQNDSAVKTIPETLLSYESNTTQLAQSQPIINTNNNIKERRESSVVFFTKLATYSQRRDSSISINTNNTTNTFNELNLTLSPLDSLDLNINTNNNNNNNYKSQSISPPVVISPIPSIDSNNEINNNNNKNSNDSDLEILSCSLKNSQTGA